MRARIGLGLGLVFLPLLLTTALLLSQLRAIPMFDDYQALIGFSVNFHRLPTAPLRIIYIFTAQHDEYKLIFLHLLEALDLTLSSHIHYRLLALLGNSFVGGILYLYWINFRLEDQIDRRLLLFAPISLLLFQLNYVETLDWAMCGLQMLAVIFFALLALHGLSLSTYRGFWLAVVAALFCCFASASGFAMAPVGFLLLLQQRRFRRVIIWFFPFVIVALIYGYHYASTSRISLIAHPTAGQRLYFLLSFLGGAVENQHHFPVRGISVLFGLAVVCALLVAVRYKYQQTHPFHFYAGFWLILTALGVAQFRSRLGLDSALVNRYKIYSDLAFIFIYLVTLSRVTRLLERASTRRIFITAVFAFSTALYCSSGYLGFKFLKTRRIRMEAGFRGYLKDPEHFSPEVSNVDDFLAGTEPEYSRKIMNEAREKGLFQVPEEYESQNEKLSQP